MTRYRVRAILIYEVEAPDEDTVYAQADELWVLDVEKTEIDVQRVTEVIR